MTVRERFLLVATVVGFLVPTGMVVAFVIEHGADFGQYFGDWVGTLPATQLTADLVIATVAFIGWAFWESRRIGRRRLWLITIPATALVGVCFAIPLFLLLRERILTLPKP